MAKKKTSHSAQATKSLTQKSKVQLRSTGLNNMTNWLIVLVLVLPILFSRYTIDPLITVRYIFLSLFVLLFVLYFFLFKKIKVNFLFPPFIKAVFAVGIAYGAWSLVCMFYAINVTPAYYEIARHFLNIILLFLVMMIVEIEGTQILKLCKAITIVALIQSIVGILQNYHIAFTDIPGAFPPYGLMANRNHFGSAQVLLLPFVIFVLHKAAKSWKYISILSLTAIFVSVLISQTRSAWLSAVGLIMVAIVLVIIFSPQNRKKWIAATLIGTIIVTGIVTLILVTNHESSFLNSIKERALTLIQGREYSNAEIGGGRAALWNKSLKLIKHHPVTGTGSGNWNLAIINYRSEGTVWANGLTVPSWPHNVYLQVACETGIPGALLYFSIWILVAIAAIKTISKSKSEDVRVITILMFAGLTAFAINSMFSFPTERIEHSLYLVLISGIILGYYANLTLSEKNEGPINKWLLIVSVFILVFNLFIAYKKYNFEIHTNLAKAYRMQNQYVDVLEEVEAAKTIFVTIDPSGDPLELHSSAAYQGLKNYDMALKEIKIAKSYHPNSARIYTSMGVIYADMKQYDSAINCYLHALQLTPRYEVAIKNLAVIYFNLGNYSACIEMLKRGIDYTPYFRDLYYEAERRLAK